MVEIRLATIEDFDGIMEVEQEEFGPLGQGAMASSEVMANRIALCNSQDPGWFWVAEHERRIVGDMILQPTHLTPAECTSWDRATDRGTLVSTFDRTGQNVYVVSLAASQSAPPGTSDLLMHASLVAWARHGGIYMFVSRMPGFARAHRTSAISPEEYWQLKRRDGSPRDPMLRLYWTRSGRVEPFRLLRDGFPPDEESGGHGVLFVLTDPYRALLATAEYVHQGGVAAGARPRRQRRTPKAR